MRIVGLPLKVQSASRDIALLIFWGGVSGQGRAPFSLPPGESPETHFKGSRVGRAVQNGYGKKPPLSLPGFENQAVQPIASRNTDYAIPTD
jgi:hypothetical protein